MPTIKTVIEYTEKELKEHLVKVRGIVEQLYEMTRKNDGIFR